MDRRGLKTCATRDEPWNAPLPFGTGRLRVAGGIRRWGGAAYCRPIDRRQRRSFAASTRPGCDEAPRGTADHRRSGTRRLDVGHHPNDRYGSSFRRARSASTNSRELEPPGGDYVPRPSSASPTERSGPAVVRQRMVTSDSSRARGARGARRPPRSPADGIITCSAIPEWSPGMLIRIAHVGGFIARPHGRSATYGRAPSMFCFFGDRSGSSRSLYAYTFAAQSAWARRRRRD